MTNLTNLSSVDSEELFQFYRERGNAENFIKERKAGFFGDKTDSSTMVKNEVRMMMGYLAYNLYLFLKQLAGDEVKALTIKRFRPLFLHIAENMSLLLDDIFSNSQVYTPIQNSFKPYLIQSAR
ncbi:transposase [Streptococcus pseudopneumoniae]|nr:transposase [Streptococcus pseudopneumoniae]